MVERHDAHEEAATGTVTCTPDTKVEAALQDALALGLNARPSSPVAVALVEALVEAVRAHEAEDGARSYRRGAAALDKLRLAVGAFVGGILLNSARRGDGGAWSYQALGTEAFTGHDVSKRVFAAARAGLTGKGMIEEAPAFSRFFGDKGEGRAMAQRYASRFRATPALWAMAARHGLAGPEGVAGLFHRVRPKAPVEPLTLRTLRPEGARGQALGALQPIPEGAETDALRDGVRAMNERIAGVTVDGCDPVVLQRSFTETLGHGGRWYALGGGYQQMGGEERVSRLRINGMPVVEVDATASFLTILHGVLSLPVPDGDPYEAAMGLPRGVVKAWTAQTIGKGKPVNSWSKRALEDGASKGVPLADYKARDVGRAVLARFPFLADLPARLGCPEKPRLTSLRLQRIEADALTFAMGALWREGVPSLPMHDGLIVPHDAAPRAKLAMGEGYWRACGAVPKFNVSGCP